MRYLILACVTLTIVCKATCYVVASTKDVEITTVSQKDNSPIVSEDQREEKKPQKELLKDDKRIYLDDVIFALNHQNWTEDELPCLNHTLQLMYNLQNSTLWAVWDWDSTSAEPEGILFGNRYHLGNFDECMSTPWAETHPSLHTQYCLAEIILERVDNKPVNKKHDLFDPYGSTLDYLERHDKFQGSLNKLTWGACVPASCSPSSVVRLLDILLTRSYVGAAGLRGKVSITEQCQKINQRRPYNGLFYGFVGTMSCLLVIVLICTYLNSKTKQEQRESSIGKEIIKAFCLKTNYKDIYRVQRDGLEVLYGIRFLSICVVVLGHQYGTSNGGPVTNGFNVDKDVMGIIGMIVLHDDLVVDSFFYLSGFLSAKGLVNKERFPNLLVLFLQRYVRLAVGFAVVIFFIVGVFPYIGSGPLWNRAVAMETESCRENWWLGLLMLGNYVNSDNICLTISWYIPCDFHFFVITVLLYYLYKKLPLFGCVCATVVSVAAFIIPGVINYLYKLPAIQLFSYEFLSNPRGDTQFQVSYIKSHTRYAPYLIGFFFGYYFATRSKEGRLGRISWNWSVFAASVSIVVMLLAMMLGPALLWAEYGLLVDTVYATLNRPAWSIGLAVLVLCCSLGSVPIVKSFLSWYPWVPLSRLTYGLYLCHSLIIVRNVQVIRSPQHVDYLINLYSTIGVIVFGTLVSLVLYLIAEAPVNNLFNLCLKPRRRKVESNENVIAENGRPTLHSSAAAADNKRYLHDNLPQNNIIYSSKI